MGNAAHSKEPEQKLAAPKIHVWTTAKEFCHKKQVTLQIEAKAMSWTGRDYTVKEECGGKTAFHISGKIFSKVWRAKILDKDKTEILLIEKSQFHKEPTYRIFSGGPSPQLLMEVPFEVTGKRLKSRIFFRNREDYESIRMQLRGDVSRTEVTLWLETEAGRLAVVRLNPPGSSSRLLSAHRKQSRVFLQRCG